jgi:hypothetical protein
LSLGLENCIFKKNKKWGVLDTKWICKRQAQ